MIFPIVATASAPVDVRAQQCRERFCILAEAQLPDGLRAQLAQCCPGGAGLCFPSHPTAEIQNGAGSPPATSCNRMGKSRLSPSHCRAVRLQSAAEQLKPSLGSTKAIQWLILDFMRTRVPQDLSNRIANNKSVAAPDNVAAANMQGRMHAKVRKP